MSIVTVIVKGGTSAANIWTGDDGKSSGPTKGNGSNGGAVTQINLHQGVNPGVSSVTLAAFLASSAGKSLAAAGGISVHA